MDSLHAGEGSGDGDGFESDVELFIGSLSGDDPASRRIAFHSQFCNRTNVLMACTFGWE